VSEAREYGSAGEVLDAVDALARRVEASLAAIARRLPGAAPFASSAAADHARHRRDREAIRARLRLPPASVAPSAEPAVALDVLREVQQELVHAHAEGLPALDDSRAVAVLAGHLVDVSRHLAVIDLWIAGEEDRAG
jgi:hypothetical protein